MQFLKTLLIVFTVALGVGFAFNNWDVVPVRLWNGLLLDINLPLLMLVCFLAGMIPTWLWQRAVRWRVSQRLATCERTVGDLRNVVVAPVPAALPEGQPLPAPGGAPTGGEPRA